MKRSRIQAIEHITIEAPKGAEEEMVWFYTEVGRLDWCEVDDVTDAQLCFKSARLQLRVRLVERPEVDPLVRRLNLRVPSLEEAAELLEDHKAAYHYLSGLSYTDRRLVVHDPAGHRLEIRQEWPEL